MRRNASFLLVWIFFPMVVGCSNGLGQTVPEHYGVFLVQDSSLLELAQVTGPPEANVLTQIPQTASSAPSVALWRPQVDLDNLFLLKYEVGNESYYEYEATPIGEEGALRIRPKTDLAPGVYCVVQASFSVSYYQQPYWCFGIAHSSAVNDIKGDESNEQTLAHDNPWQLVPLIATMDDNYLKEGWSYLTVFFGIENITPTPIRLLDSLYEEGVSMETSDGFNYPAESASLGVSLAFSDALLPPFYPVTIDYEGSTNPLATINYVSFWVPSISSGHQVVLPDGNRISLADVPVISGLDIIDWRSLPDPDELRTKILIHEKSFPREGNAGDLGVYYPFGQNGELMIKDVIDRTPFSITISASFRNTNPGQSAHFVVPPLFGNDGVVYRRPEANLTIGPGLTEEVNIRYDLIGSRSVYALVGNEQETVWINLE